MKKYTVSQITRYVKAVLEEDAVLSDVLLEGEVAGLKHHSSGHIYFTLKDDLCALNCVMFRQNAENLKFQPHNGAKVAAWGRVSMFEKSGACQLVANLLTPLGEGELHLALEQLKQRLEAQGLFEASRKRPLPSYPSAIGIVTSGDGAGLADIIQVASRRAPACRLILAPARVQGDGAAEAIAQAVSLINRHGEADVLIIGRGGGSAQDLWAFNEEAVAMAVFTSKIPVISAVGHETDFTICDLVADLRAPTPSAAAELATSLYATLERELHALTQLLQNTISAKLSDAEKRLALVLQSSEYPQNQVRVAKLQAKALLGRMNSAQTGRLELAKSAMSGMCALLESFSPLQTLARGYACVSKDDTAIHSALQLYPGDNILLQLSDGKATCSVTTVTS